MLKRFGIFLLAVMMLVGTSVPAFAAGPETASVAVSDGPTVMETTMDIVSPASVTSNPTVSGILHTNEANLVLYPTMASYVGFNKTFHIVTTSDATQGAVYVELYAPGKYDQDPISGDWTVGVNDSGSFSFFLPVSGTYKMIVRNWGINAPVTITAWWE